MEVIVSHIGTDFDALAAMVACSKLHPQAKMVLAGNQRPSVRQFVALHRETLSLYRAKQLDLQQISRLYIVDAPDCQRLGDLNYLCQRADRVTVYDHHPPFDADGDDIRERVGATTTILVEKIKSQDIVVQAFEATLFLLGIYEDTRCLTNANTTVRDMLAAAWLLEMGANLAEVSKYIYIPMDTNQKDLFSTLLGEAQTHVINQRAILVTQASLDQFVGGLGRMTQQLMELEACDLAVSIVTMENRVHMVARSMRPELNLLQILEPMDVRGHAGAVTLTSKDSDVHELTTRVKDVLEQRLPHGQLAADIMSTPVKSVEDGTTVREAHRLLLRYGHTGMPVINKSKVVVGIISRTDVEKAIRHDLGHAPVRGYMTRNVVSVTADASLDDVTKLIIQNNIGRVPVLDKDKLVGIITRTDVLEHIHGDSAPRWHKSLFNQQDYRIAQSKDNLTDLINTRLPKRVQGILLLLGQKAEIEGFKAYAVGGFVRDLLLGLPNLDLDLAVEEDAISFARMLPPLLGGKLQEYPEFGTATLTLPDGFQIDFATARMEFYQFPAASPEVEQATIRHDLYRRDFTINTLAFCLNSPCFGSFLDFFGGYDDLEAGLIRVLYNLSFVEDPTRLLRALRFAGRYGFTMEEQTATFMDSAIGENVLPKTPIPRLGREFRNLFNEPNVPILLTMAREAGILDSLVPEIEWNGELELKLTATAQIIEWNEEQMITEDQWLLYPLVLTPELPTRRRHEVLSIFGLTDGEISSLDKLDLQALSRRLRETSLEASDIYDLLEPVSALGLLALLALNSGEAQLRTRVMLYLEELADVEIAIDGYDLQNIGYQSGPEMGKVLRTVHRAKLDGTVRTRQDELDLATEMKDEGE